MKKLLLTIFFLFFPILAFAAPQYFIGAINGNWGQIGNWSATSGGLTNGTIPANGDDVYLDGNSPSCTLNVTTNNLNSFNMTGYTRTISAAYKIIRVSPLSGTTNCLLAGTFTGSIYFYFDPASGATVNLTTNGIGIGVCNFEVNLLSGSGNISQQDNININTIQMKNGVWNTNNFNITVNSWLVYGGTFSAGTSNLTITTGGTFTDEIGQTYGTLQINPGNTITFTNGVTYTMSSFIANGTAGSPITLESDSAGNQFTLSQASGTNNVYYCSIQDSNAIGGATWNAYTTNGNTNVSDNTGWHFTSSAISHGFTQFLNR